MIRLSAVIITFNEEKNIGRCLESLKGVADEIVVLDSFSTDQTESICREHGVRFIRHPLAVTLNRRTKYCAWRTTIMCSPWMLTKHYPLS